MNQDIIEMCKQGNTFVEVLPEKPLTAKFIIPRNVFLDTSETVLEYSVKDGGFDVSDGQKSKFVKCGNYARRVVVFFDVLFASTNAWVNRDVNSVVFCRKRGTSYKVMSFNDVLSVFKVANIGDKREGLLLKIVISMLSSVINYNYNTYVKLAKEMGVIDGFNLLEHVMSNVSVNSVFLVNGR